MRGARRPPAIALAGALAVVLVAAGIAALAIRAGGRQPTGPGARRDSPAVPAAPAVAPVLLPDTGRGPLPSAAGLLRRLAGSLRDGRLGARVAYAVVDAESGRYLTGRDTTRPATPASVTKLVTAAAVLQAVGPLARIPTRVVAGALPGEVVLVGGGDPTLSVGTRQAYPGAGRLDLLATAVRRTFGAAVHRVVVDGSVYPGPATGPGWDTDLVTSGYVAPITAVMIDGGRVDPLRPARSPLPDLAAGRALARLLGVPRAAVSRGRAPAGARELARIISAPVATLVEQALTASDNVLAEALARQVAFARRLPGSFAGAATAVRATMAGLGLPVAGLRLVDGSGLSRSDLLTAGLLTGVLSAAAGPRHLALRALLSGLPVAGFNGTLGDRFRLAGDRSAAGRVRAKTGTLSGVSALAGVIRDSDGRLLAFAVLADRVPPGGTGGAEIALDRVAAVLAGCGCR